MALLSKAQILGADDLKTEDVNVPEWGGTVRLRGLTGRERDRYEESCVNTKTGAAKIQDATARLVAWSIVDEDGNRLFSDAEIGELARKSGAAIQRCFNVAARLAGLTQEDIDNMTESFDDAPSGDSTSD